MKGQAAEGYHWSHCRSVCPECGCAVQGNDNDGRPLLQKALYIQEAALGPDHPDVQAIRDVLEGED